MDQEADLEGWADLAALRRAEDEKLIQRYARAEGRGLDMRPVRNFVKHVRRDLGPKAIICEVKMTVDRGGHEVVVGYYFPDECNKAPAPASELSIASVPMHASATPRASGPEAASPATAVARLMMPSATTQPR
jgi:hypothetical protein